MLLDDLPVLDDWTGRHSDGAGAVYYYDHETEDQRIHVEYEDGGYEITLLTGVSEEEPNTVRGPASPRTVADRDRLIRVYAGCPEGLASEEE